MEAKAGSNGHTRKPDVREEIDMLLARASNAKRLANVRRMIERPGSRVFVPNGPAGHLLFNRIVDLDNVYAVCERKLWRAGTRESLGAKQGLEDQLVQLNLTLIEITAQMALEHSVEEARFDPVVSARLRHLRAERGPRSAASELKAGGTD